MFLNHERISMSKFLKDTCIQWQSCNLKLMKLKCTQNSFGWSNKKENRTMFFQHQNMGFTYLEAQMKRKNPKTIYILLDLTTSRIWKFWTQRNLNFLNIMRQNFMLKSSNLSQKELLHFLDFYTQQNILESTSMCLEVEMIKYIHNLNHQLWTIWMSMI